MIQLYIIVYENLHSYIIIYQNEIEDMEGKISRDRRSPIS